MRLLLKSTCHDRAIKQGRAGSEAILLTDTHVLVQVEVAQRTLIDEQALRRMIAVMVPAYV